MPGPALLEPKSSTRSQHLFRTGTGPLLAHSMLLCLVSCDTKSSGSVDARLVFPDSLAALLAEAVVDGDSVRIRKLIGAGADPNAHGDKGVTLLQWAILNQSKRGLAGLLAGGADPKASDSSGETVVHWAAKANDAEYLGILLRQGADPNTRNTVTNATPMMSALMGNREVQFSALLKAGAKPNLADRFDNTSLHLASKFYAYDRIVDLLEAGADPALKNRQGFTFQHYLARAPMNLLSEDGKRGRESVAAWLRNHGVTPEFATGR
jgi:ankyrin repeat protein